MIFLTVGSQLPFDRLVAAMDAWAAANPGAEIFGQTCELGPENHVPRHFDHAPRLDAAAFEAALDRARLVVAHAGTGSLIDALTRARPILVMPRRAALGETRNDHQLATAARFAARPGVHVAEDAAALGPALDRLAGPGAGEAPPALGAEAEPRLVAAIRAVLFDGDPA